MVNLRLGAGERSGAADAWWTRREAISPAEEWRRNRRRVVGIMGEFQKRFVRRI
jgi:hypothetical protein